MRVCRFRCGWLIIAVGSPLLAFSGVLMAQWLTRKTARESDVRWRRGETMRMLRWASELAASADAAGRRVGLAALDALDDSEMLQTDDQALISAVLAVLVARRVEEYDVGDELEEH